MMINASRFGSSVVYIVMMVCTFGMLVSTSYGVWVSAGERQLGVVFFLLLLIIFWMLLFFYILYEVPRVLLTEEGIWVRFVFRKQYFSWSEILQAGILWRMGRGMWYNDFVLLLPNGYPRQYKDKTFLLRNYGKIIHMKVTEEVRNYVIKHYGPLDFDLSDGKSEQSIVVD